MFDKRGGTLANWASGLLNVWLTGWAIISNIFPLNNSLGTTVDRKLCIGGRLISMQLLPLFRAALMTPVISCYGISLVCRTWVTVNISYIQHLAVLVFHWLFHSALWLTESPQRFISAYATTSLSTTATCSYDWVACYSAWQSLLVLVSILWSNPGSILFTVVRHVACVNLCSLILKGNCSEKFLLQNIFGFHVYITNIYVKLSTETVIMQKKQLWW